MNESRLSSAGPASPRSQLPTDLSSRASGSRTNTVTRADTRTYSQHIGRNLLDDSEIDKVGDGTDILRTSLRKSAYSATESASVTREQSTRGFSSRALVTKTLSGRSLSSRGGSNRSHMSHLSSRQFIISSRLGRSHDLERSRLLQELENQAAVEAMEAAQQRRPSEDTFAHHVSTVSKPLLEFLECVLLCHTAAPVKTKKSLELVRRFIRNSQSFEVGRPVRLLKDAKARLSVADLSTAEGVVSLGNLERSYQVEASSSDELALLMGMGPLGHKVLERTATELSVLANGIPQRWEIIGFHEFTSERKRMSVVLKKMAMPRLGRSDQQGTSWVSAVGTVGWDGNGLAYPHRTGFSYDKQTSVTTVSLHSPCHRVACQIFGQSCRIC